MITFEYGPSGTSRMTRRKLFGGAALSGLALSSVGTPAASTSLATAPAGGLTRLSLNENPLGPSSLAVEAIQNALTEIARYADDDTHALEQQIADREGVSPDQIILGKILDPLGLQLALDGGAGGEFIYSEPGYTALVDAVASGGGVVVGVPLNPHLENHLRGQQECRQTQADTLHVHHILLGYPSSSGCTQQPPSGSTLFVRMQDGA
jgi:histidinol-phosphate/aromatic aminotransferase/cobyric acid decarboxylase-like protein